MVDFLAAGLGGAAKGGSQYTEKLISEQMQKRRDERLAGIRRAETGEARGYSKGLIDEGRTYDEGREAEALEREGKLSAEKTKEQAGIETLKHERGLIGTTHETDEEIRKAKELNEAGVTSTGKKASGKAGTAATNAYKQYQEMLGLGKNKDTAFAIAYKTIKTLKDEYGGDEQLVDIATNQLVGMIKEDEGTGKKSYVPTLGAKPTPKVSGYPEGTRLKGPNGIYVVRNGKPVLEGEE